MSALAIAMILTGAGALADQPAPSSTPLINAPLPAGVPAPPPRAIPPQRARANLGEYFSAEDYPAQGLRARHTGTAAFALHIGPDGRVSDCKITVSSGSGPLDLATCRILTRRARYSPAREEEDRPTIGLDRGRITWRLPEPLPGRPADRAGLAMAYQPAAPQNEDAARLAVADYPRGAHLPGPGSASVLRVVVGRNGRVIGCDIESGGLPEVAAAACRLYAARARFEPARDAAGRAVCDVTWTVIGWTRGSASTPASRPGTAPPPVRAPLPLHAQLNARLCPGWARPQ